MNGRKRFAIVLSGALVLSVAFADVPMNGTHAATGLDQRVHAGTRVLLTGGGWTTTPRVVRFAWQQVDGPRVQLHNANRSTASFYAPKVTKATVLKFRLTVTDVRGGSGSNVVAVTVVPRSQSLAPAMQSSAERNGVRQ